MIFWRRGNQVKILNRPATVSPMQRFGNRLATEKSRRQKAERISGRQSKTGISQETCQRTINHQPFRGIKRWNSMKLQVIKGFFAAIALFVRDSSFRFATFGMTTTLSKMEGGRSGGGGKNVLIAHTLCVAAALLYSTTVGVCHSETPLRQAEKKER